MSKDAMNSVFEKSNEALEKFQKEWAEKEARQKATNVCECECHAPVVEGAGRYGHSNHCCTTCLFCGTRQIMDAARHAPVCSRRLEAKSDPTPFTYPTQPEHQRNVDNLKQTLLVLVHHALLGDSVAVGKMAQYLVAVYPPKSLEVYVKEILTPSYEV